jgi:hypothetical protein
MDTDGALDYSGFTRQQLAEALERIDRSRYPRNYTNLTNELASRPIENPEPNRPTVSGGSSHQVQRYRGTAQWLFPVLQIYVGGTAAVNFGRQILGEGLDFGSAAFLVAMIGFGLFSALAAVRFFHGNPDGATLCFWGACLSRIEGNVPTNPPPGLFAFDEPHNLRPRVRFWPYSTKSAFAPITMPSCAPGWVETRC